ncbi:MAG TPA: hypothetical protein VNK49_11795 [Anaerolineales bacterium]|nr:hypothetical protein [Anaerolineales bacterium]
MNSNALASQDLVRRAIIEVAQLEEKELLIVIEMVDTLKKQRARPHKELAAEILAKAKARAEEMKHLSREEAMERFGRTLDAIRADAIAKGTAIEGEWERD